MTKTEQRDARIRRNADLIRLKHRPTPWNDGQWREWASVQAADILDHGRAGRHPDGTIYLDHAFRVGRRVLVCGPFNTDTTRLELGGRAADLIELENA